jgi:hypothetical protein
MRGYRLIRQLKEVHEMELELLSVVIIIGVRSGKGKKPEELPPANIPPVEWSTRFHFLGGSKSRIKNKHV